jgi:hypothetical protein
MRLVLGMLLGAAGAFAISRRPPSGHRPPQPRRRGGQGVGAPPHRNSDGHAASDHAHGEARVEQPVVVPRQPASPDHLASDEEHKAEERDYWRRSLNVSIWATVIAFGGWVLAFAVFHATWQAMETTQEQARVAQAALIASDRPWLKIKSVSVSEVSVDRLGTTIRLSVKAKNIGRSPALRGLALVEVLPDMRDGEPARLAAPLCRRAAADRDLAEVEGVVFPDAERETHHLRFVLPSDVRAARDRARSREATGGREPPVEPAPEGLRTQIAIVGCTTYAFHAGRAIGQTAFVYDLARNCGPLGHEWPCDFDLSEQGEWSGDTIVVREADFAGFAR